MILSDSEAPEIATRGVTGRWQTGQVAGRIAGLLPARDRSRRIVFAAGAGVVQRFVQVAAALVIFPLLLRALGPARFGVWGAATSLAWLNGMLDLGLGAALITLVGKSTAHNCQSDARRHVTGALILGSGLGALALVVAWVCVWVAVPSAEAGPYLIAVAGLAINIPLNGTNCIWLGLQKGYVSAFWELIQTLTITTGLIVTTWLTVDVRVYVAVVYGGVILANLASLCHLFLRHPELRPRAWLASLKEAQGIAGKGMMYFAASLAGGLSYLLDNVLALQLLGPVASARMAVALRVCTSAMGVLMVVSQPLWPAFSEAAVRGDLRWIRRSLVRGMALLMGMAAAGAAVLVVAGGPFLKLWLPTDLGIGPDVLWATAAWILAQAAGRVPGLLLNAVGVVRFQAMLCAIATFAALCLKFLWAPWLGVAGILWATTAAASLISLPALVWRGRHWLNRMRICTM